MKDQIPDASKDAIIKATEAAEAVEVSRATQLQAVLDETEKRTISTLSDVLTKVFGDFEVSGRFIDLKKIPLICAQISQIHTDIGNTNKNVESINDNIKWAVRLIVAAVITISVSAIIALITLSVKK